MLLEGCLASKSWEAHSCVAECRLPAVQPSLIQDVGFAPPIEWHAPVFSGLIMVQCKCSRSLLLPVLPVVRSLARRTTGGPVAAACLLLDPIQPRIARPCPCGWIILYSASLIGSGGQELATRPIVYALALSVCTVSRVPIDSTACAYEYGWATTDLSRQSALIYGPSQ